MHEFDLSEIFGEHVDKKLFERIDDSVSKISFMNYRNSNKKKDYEACIENMYDMERQAKEMRRKLVWALYLLDEKWKSA